MAFSLYDPVGPAPAAHPFTMPGFGTGQNAFQVARNSGGIAPHPFSGGFTPAYGYDIANDPLFAQQQQQVNAQNQAAQGQASTGFGQALANYGQIPDFSQAASQLGLDASSPLYGLLQRAAQDPNTVASAHALTQAGLSTEGQLGQQRDTGIAQLLSGLAGRGTVQSGATTAGLDLQERGNTQRQYAATQTLLQQLGQIVSGYNTSQQQGIGQLQQGAQQAAARQIAMNPNVPAGLAQSIAATFGGTS